MEESAAKRAAEAAAMADFDMGFAVRHRGAFASIYTTIGLDYFSIDCAEAPDGRLLVFEADVAAIIHSMDDPVVYPYKQAAMQRCYEGFAAMVRRRAAGERLSGIEACCPCPNGGQADQQIEHRGVHAGQAG
jgi:hypothetical protein